MNDFNQAWPSVPQFQGTGAMDMLARREREKAAQQEQTALAQQQAAGQGGLRGFNARLQQDPMMAMALMQAGTSIMQPVQPNQTAAGHLAQGAMGGVSALQNMRSNAAQGKREARKDDLEELKVMGEVETKSREQRLKEAQFRQSAREYDEASPMRNTELDYKRAQIRALDREGTGETERLADRLGSIFYRQNPEQYGSPEGAYVAAVDYLQTVGKGSSMQQFTNEFWGNVGPLVALMPDMAPELSRVYNDLSKQLAPVFQQSQLPRRPGQETAAAPTPPSRDAVVQMAKDALTQGVPAERILQQAEAMGITLTPEELGAQKKSGGAQMWEDIKKAPETGTIPRPSFPGYSP